MLHLVDKDFGAIISAFRELKETMMEEFKEGIITMSYQIQNIYQEMMKKKEPSTNSGAEKDHD